MRIGKTKTKMIIFKNGIEKLEGGKLKVSFKNKVRWDLKKEIIIFL